MKPSEFDGGTFRELRRRADITQAQLAEMGKLAGLDGQQGEIYRIERHNQHIRGWQRIETYRQILAQYDEV